MKRMLLLSCVIIIAFGAACYAAETKFGSLNIFTKNPSADVFVDGEIKGHGSAHIKEIQAGTHFVLVATGESGNQIVSFSDVVDVIAGKETTIYIDAQGSASGLNRTAIPADQVDVFKVKRVIDYSREMHTGWYLKLGYLSNLYYNIDSPSHDNYASTIDLGIGVKFPIAPGLDFSLEMERAQLNTAHDTWFIMPITANIQLSFLPGPYFRGKQYYGLGIGYYITDLENDYKQNLTSLGYHLFYGIEVPASDDSAFFFEFGYHSSDISRYDYAMNAAYASVGFRWDVLK